MPLGCPQGSDLSSNETPILRSIESATVVVIEGLVTVSPASVTAVPVWSMGLPDVITPE